MSAKRDLMGQRFGRLLVVASAPNSAAGKARWQCQCDCGREVVIVLGTNLSNGHTTSCGCLPREIAAANATKRNLVHGHNRAGKGKQSPTWSSWAAMLKRCRNPKAFGYKDYGGRGITVCERWLTFENFLADMGERPAGKTLDRINNDGNYEPGNCRWATASEQQRNKRKRVAP